MSGAQNGQLWRWYEMLELEYASSSCDSVRDMDGFPSRMD